MSFKKKISVEFDTDTVFRDWIYVNREIPQYCTCDVLTMAPVYALNFQKKICAECGNIVTELKENGYDEFFGYSGYDELN